MKVFDLSSQHPVVGPNTSLSYWIYPQSSATSSSVSGSNSSCVAIDLIFTDGTALRNVGAVDQHGNQVHPAHQCGHLNLDQWNQVISNIGAVANGKTISKLDEGYDQPANTGGYRGYIDDISLSNPASSTPLFTTGFESGDPQPSWTNTVDTGPEAGAGNIANVGGICCGLTGPEAGPRQEVVHTDAVALPQVTYTYTTQTNYYEDSFFKPNPSTNCGPSWNTGNGSGCLLWEQNYANNSRFLTSVSNGQGLAQSFSWMLARNNSHGVNGGGNNNADPLYCNSHQAGYPCNEADDSGWSHVVLSQVSSTTIRLTQNGQGGQQTSTPITETTGYIYQLTYPLPAQECSDCVAAMYWGDQNDNDYLSYYNGTFMGFAQTKVNAPSGAVEVHKFYAGEGWGIYDPQQVTCFTQAPCHAAPWWDLANAAHGQECQTLAYDTDGQTLLKEVDSSYQAICPPTGVAGTPPNGSITWDGKLISDLDHNNPVAACDIQQTQQVSKAFVGGSNSSNTTTSQVYDSFGRATQETTTSNGGTPAKVVHNTSYVWNDSVTATKTSATGTYIIDTPAFTDTEDGSGNRLRCSYSSYDGQSYTTGQSSTLTGSMQTVQDDYADCGTSANGYTLSGKSTTTALYNTHGDVIATDDPDANATIAGHTGCTVNSTQYTSCIAYDSTYAVFTTSAGNALNQAASTSYANTGNVFGFGTWPVSTTNANKQTTSYTYDALGRVTGETLPGETTGDLTKQWVYTDWCSGTAAQSPCLEIDEIDRLNSSATVTTRAFYDGEGRLVETRAPGPAGQDVVTYKYYDSSGRSIFKSDPYFVTAYTGTPGSAAYSIPDSTQPGTSTTYPTLRQTSVTDPNSHTTTTTASVICGVSGTSDTGCYAQAMVLDANGHESATLTGGLGQTNYQQLYTGNSTYTLYSTTIKTYDAAGELLSTVAPDGSTTATSVYDALGRKTSQTDPDSGKTTATYDPNGNLLESVDARGSAGTVFAGYDGLNRPLWRNSTNSSSGAWATYTYDSTANGNQGVGELTGETFSGGGGLSGAYAYTYDARGQQVGETVTVNGTNYPVQATYNDNGQLISQTYPTGEVVTSGYSSTGWLSGLTTSLNSVNTTLANNLSYSGLAGAAGHITAMSVGSTYNYAASFDTGMRLTSASLTNTSTSALLYQTQPAYDAVNNVVSVQTSVSGQTDTQQFCYDDLSRLTWAGTNGTPPCSGTAITAGTLASAQYQQSDSYDVDGRLTNGPSGSYTYGDTSHPHAVTSTSKGYSAAYDAAGNMTCRALTTATTCSGTPTAQQLSYDAEGRLSSWQNQPASPSQTANYLYDGSGNRVAMQSTVNGTTTLTAYIGSIEEVQTTGSTTQTTTYYTVGGARIAANVNGTFYYFGYDALGSQVVVLNSSGSVSGAQLYGPYGSSRYSTGTLPTSIGFTDQLNDSVTGLDYYIARYYDPAVGAFLSVDSLQGNAQGMDPYAYVAGNPETETDPTGERIADMNGDTAYVAPAGNNQWKLTSYTSTTSYWATMSYTYVIGRNFHRTSPVSYTRHYYPTHRNVPVVHHPTHSSRGTSLWHNVAGVATTLLDLATGIPSMINDVHTIFGTNAPWYAKLGAGVDLAFNAVSDVLMFTGAGELIRGGTILEHLGADELEHLGAQALADCGLGLSFVAATRVATAQGERAIGSLHPADKVWAYNPKTHKMELQPILHVWINHDHDLVDLTLTTSTKAQHGKTALRTSEVIHTNKRHPFLTRERGFLPVGQITLRMHVLRADGTYGVVTDWKVVSGTKVMYNLEVAQDHTFTVGTGEWVVHNASCMVKDLNPLHSPETSGRRPELEKLSDQELLNSVNNPKNGDPIRISTKTGKVMDGNGRAYELLRRAALPGSSITPDTPIYYDPYTPSSLP